MQKILSFLSLLLISSLSLCQNVIHTDTTITQTIGLMESFELRFERSPGGNTWYLPGKYDSTQVTIHLKNREVMNGYGPKGGKYIYTYEYTGLIKGTYHFEYVFGRPWLNQKLKKCNLIINVI